MFLELLLAFLADGGETAVPIPPAPEPVQVEVALGAIAAEARDVAEANGVPPH